MTFLIASWILGIVFIFFKNDPPPPLALWLDFVNLLSFSARIVAGGLGRNLFLTTAAWFVFTAMGDFLFRRLGLSGASRPERLLISAGIGAGTASLLMLGLGLAGGWRPLLLRGVVFAVAALGLTRALFHLNRTVDASKTSADPENPAQNKINAWAYVALILIAAAVALNLLATASPEIFYDSLVYHLALPKLYLLHGRIVPTPHNLYSGMPFGMEMLYGLALSLSDEHLALLLNCTFGWGAAAALWTWLRRHASADTGIFGVLIFSLSPVVLYSGTQCGVDLGASFFAALALLAVSHALQAANEIQSRRWSMAAGILVGFFLGAKYTAIPLGAVFVLTHGWIRRRDGRSLDDTVWMAASAAVAFSPWLFKNLYFYGDPFYPFLHQHLGWTSPAHWEFFLSDAQSRNLSKTFGSLNGWKSFVREPWTLASGDTPDQRIGPTYLILVPWFFSTRWGFFKKDSPMSPACTAAAILAPIGFLTWWISTTLVRFLVPTLIVAAGVLALAVRRRNDPPWLRHAVWIIAVGIGAHNLLGQFVGSRYLGKWDVLRDRQSQADYLKIERASYGQPYFAAMEYINQSLPQNAKIVFLGEPRGYYCEREFIAATVFDNNPFWIAARDANSPAEFHDKLRALGITHVFLNAYQLYMNARYEAMLPRNVIDRPIVSEFWARYLKKVYDKLDYKTDGHQIKDWLIVYELQDTPIERPEAGMNPVSFTLLQVRNQGL